MVAHGITSHKLKRRHVTNAGRGIPRPTPLQLRFLAWFKEYITNVCDKMPTKDEVHTPFYLTWGEIYQDCNNYLRDQGEKPLSVFQMTHLRRKFFPKLKKPKYTRQDKCDVC